jgi:uncharacterized protein (TIGR03000 family)
MKGNVLRRDAPVLAALGFLTLLVTSASAGPPSGGRSRGANRFGGGSGYYATPAYYGGYPQGISAAPAYSPAPAANVNRAFYFDPDAETGAEGTAAVIHVEVHASAEVWFNGYKTKLTGPERRFVSPLLQPGQTYTYRLRVRWLDNGVEIDQTRTIAVARGERTHVVFVPVATGSSTSTSAAR